MLGASKKSIGKVIGIETVITSILSIAIGIGTLLLSYPLILKIIAKILGITNIEIFNINTFFIKETIRMFVLMHLVLGIINIFSIMRSNPIQLLQKSKEGEKEPKASIIGIVLGLSLLGYGYYAALTTDSIIKSLKVFFVAVIAVIFGTYFLFGSISIILLKALKKNKRVYYKEKNMTFISGLLFRVKESSAALASICIISTMFLVVFTSLTGLLKSKETFLEYAFPSDYALMYYGQDRDLDENIKQEIEKISQEENVPLNDIKVGEKILFGIEKKDSEFVPVVYEEGTEKVFEKDFTLVSLVNIDQFNGLSDKKYDLKDKEVLIYSNRGYTYEDFKFGKLDYKTKMLETIPNHFNSPTEGLFHNLVLVVEDSKEITDEIDEFIGNKKDGGTYTPQTDIFIDVKDNTVSNPNFTKKITEIMTSEKISQQYSTGFTDGITSRVEFSNIYSGVYIVATLLSLIFVISTSIIIYYKQIAEGVTDGKNIAIMRKMGMSQNQIKKNVSRQNFFMFFAPFFVAICHTLGSSKIVFDIVKIVGIIDKKTFIISTAIGIGIYLVVYLIMFKLSTVVYLKMASRYENR